MAEEIRQWKTNDGKLFETKEDAEAYECEQEETERLGILVDQAKVLVLSSNDKSMKERITQFIIRHKLELLDILYLKGQYRDTAFTRENLLETAGLPPEKSKNGKSKKSGKTDPELKIKKPPESSSSKSRTPIKLVKPEHLIGK